MFDSLKLWAEKMAEREAHNAAIAAEKAARKNRDTPTLWERALDNFRPPEKKQYRNRIAEEREQREFNQGFPSDW